jgi:hypothetical protein
MRHTMLTSTVSVVQFKTRHHQSRRLPIFLLFALVFLHGSKLSTADNIAIKISAPTAYSPII